MPSVFVYGHGRWKPGDGYTEVPAGTSVKFYTEANKKLGGFSAIDIMTGQAAAGGVEPDLEVGEYHTVQNIRLYPPGAALLSSAHAMVQLAGGAAGQVYIVHDAGGVVLADILTELKGNDITWVACRVLDLQHRATRIGGREQPAEGMNIEQALHYPADAAD